MSRYLKSSFYLSIPIFGLLFITGCKKKEVYPPETLPSIISLSQTSGVGGTPVVIHGNNLKNVDSVKIGSANAAGYNPGKNTDTAIHIIVPDSLPAGPTYIQVYFPNGKGYAASAFTVLATPPVPKIDSASPTIASPGATVTIHGTNFALVNSVSFNGVAATFAHALDTNGTLTTVVPAAAVGGSQFIKVSNVYGSDSVAFNVDLSPAITGMSPNAAKAGDTVTLTGARFTGATSVTLASEATAAAAARRATAATARAPAAPTSCPSWCRAWRP